MPPRHRESSCTNHFSVNSVYLPPERSRGQLLSTSTSAALQMNRVGLCFFSQVPLSPVGFLLRLGVVSGQCVEVSSRVELCIQVFLRLLASDDSIESVGSALSVLGVLEVEALLALLDVSLVFEFFLSDLDLNVLSVDLVDTLLGLLGQVTAWRPLADHGHFVVQLVDVVPVVVYQ